MRGSDADGKFVKGDAASDDDYMLQWMEGKVVNSTILHDFGVKAPNLIVYGNGFELATAAKYVGTMFHLGFKPAMATIMTDLGFVTGVDPATLKLVAHSSGAEQAMTAYNALQDKETTYGSNTLYFKSDLAPGLYEMSWGDTTFTTNRGYLEAGEVYFAGGRGGSFQHRGFELSHAPESVIADISRSNDKNVNEGFIVDSAVSVRIHTGGGNDVVVNQGGTATLVYDTIDNLAQDLVLGFGHHDYVSFEGDAAAMIDKNGDNEIAWVSGNHVTNATEGVSVGVMGAFEIGSTPAQMQPNEGVANWLANNLDVSAIAKGEHLLILVNDGMSESNVLFMYANVDGNGTVDVNELSTIAMFADGAVMTENIHVVGVHSNSAGIP